MAKNISRLFENKKYNLIKELEKGEKYGFAKEFDLKKFIKNTHGKYCHQ